MSYLKTFITWIALFAMMNYTVVFATGNPSNLFCLDSYKERFQGASGASVIQQLRDQSRVRALTFQEVFDLGTAFFLEFRYVEAATTWETAARTSESAPEKLAAIYAAARAWGMANMWSEAARLANDAAIMLPSDENIAALRVVAWKMVGDELELRSAQDHQNRLNLKLDGIEVIEPATVGVLIIIGVAIVGAVAVSYNENLSEGENAKLAGELINIAALLASVLAFMAAS